MKITRILALIFALILILSLVACGGESETETTAPETTAPSTENDEPTAPQTFDFGVIAAAAAIVSAAGYALTKKRK